MNNNWKTHNIRLGNSASLNVALPAVCCDSIQQWQIQVAQYLLLCNLIAERTTKGQKMYVKERINIELTLTRKRGQTGSTATYRAGP